jgi:hypothetical protein
LADYNGFSSLRNGLSQVRNIRKGHVTFFINSLQKQWQNNIDNVLEGDPPN